MKETVGALMDAAAASECGPTRKLLHPVFGKVDEATCEQFRLRLVGIGEARGRRYETGMVVDFTAARGMQTAVLALNDALEFGLVLIVDTGEPTVGTPLPDGADGAAERAAELIRAQDCDRFLMITTRSFGIGSGRRRDVCARLPNLGITQELQAHPSVMPERLGGNAVFAFYGLRFEPGVYYTMVMVRRDETEDDAGESSMLLVTTLPAQ